MDANREERPEEPRNHVMNINTRDRLFHAIFLKVGLVYSRTVPKAVRTGMEILLMTKALILFTMLSYIHFTFSKQPMNCLESIQDDWPRDGILRVQVLLGHDGRVPDISPSYMAWNKTAIVNTNKYTNASIYKQSGNNSNVCLYTQSLASTEPESNYIQSFFNLVLDTNKVAGRESVADTMQFRGMEKLMRGYQNVKEQYIMEFSLEYGFLRLSPATRKKLKVPIKVVNLDPLNNKCFGDSVSKFLLSRFLGYDDVLIASIKRLAELENNRGFMRNVITGEHYRFVSVWMSRSSYIVAFLLMFVFTISVATLLRFCHQQIFFFIVQLLQMLDWNVAVAFPVAPLFTVILSLVGMEVIMSEFFNDTSTSFYIILIVWAADQFDSICCHTTVSQKYWLRFFYLYHFVFYAYHYRFNGQYSSIALAASWFFIQHSMLYFLHNYELPAIESQVGRGNVDENYIDDAVELLVDGVQWPLLMDRVLERNNENNRNQAEDTSHQSVQHHATSASTEVTQDHDVSSTSERSPQLEEPSPDTASTESNDTMVNGLKHGAESDPGVDTTSKTTHTLENEDVFVFNHRTFGFLPTSGDPFIFGRQLPTDADGNLPENDCRSCQSLPDSRLSNLESTRGTANNLWEGMLNLSVVNNHRPTVDNLVSREEDETSDSIGAIDPSHVNENVDVLR